MSPSFVGDPARAREADRGRRARVGDGHDDVCRSRGFLRQALAHPHACPVELDSAELRVGAGEVDELEDAERVALALVDRLNGVEAVLVDHDELARVHLSRRLGAEQVERARLRREHPVVVEPAGDERADPVRVTEAEQLALGEEDDREGALEAAHRLGDGDLERPLVVGDQRGDDLRVGGRAELDPALTQFVPQLGRVDEVAVVPERHRPSRPLLHDGLRVGPARSAGGRVPAVSDCRRAVEPAQLVLREDLRHEAHVAQDGHPVAVRDRDPCRLLPTMLEGEEPEVGDAGHVALGSVDAEDAAH